MKKLTVFALTLALCLSVVACGNKDGDANSTEKKSEKTEQATKKATEAGTTADAIDTEDEDVEVEDTEEIDDTDDIVIDIPSEDGKPTPTIEEDDYILEFWPESDDVTKEEIKKLDDGTYDFTAYNADDKALLTIQYKEDGTVIGFNAYAYGTDEDFGEGTMIVAAVVVDENGDPVEEELLMYDVDGNEIDLGGLLEGEDTVLPEDEDIVDEK